MTTTQICRGTVGCSRKINPDATLPVFKLADDSGALSNERAVLQGSEPPNFYLINETFEDSNFASRGWYDGTPQITTDQAHSGSSSLVWDWALAASTPSGSARRLFTETETVYLTYWIKYSSSWIGSGDSFHPHMFYFMTNEDHPWVGPSFTNLTCYVESNYSAGGRPVMAAQDGANVDQANKGVDLTAITETRSACGCNGDKGWANALGDCYMGGSGWVNEKKFVQQTPKFTADQWHFVEAYIALNSITTGIGNADGIMQYWVDGELVIDESDALLRTGDHPTMKFNQFFMGPYIGSGAPAAQKIWVDDLILQSSKENAATRASSEAFTLSDTASILRTKELKTAVDTYNLADMAVVLGDNAFPVASDAFTLVGSAGVTNNSGNLWRAHEPSGMTEIDDRNFTRLDEGWFYDFVHEGAATIVNDTTAPYSPQNVIQFPYPAGQGGGGPGGRVGSHFWTTKNIVYLYLGFKLSSNFQGHDSSINKIFFLKHNNASPANNTVFMAKGSDSGTLRSFVGGQNYGCGDPSATFPANLGGSDIVTRGQWHEVEFIFTANTAGSSNGRLEMWLNGAKTHDYSSWCPLDSGEGPGFEGILCSLVWGGLGDTVANAMNIRFDHIYISGKN